jgi:Aph-1 protein
MPATAFFGYLFLSCGPPIAAGLPFFWHRSLLSLTVVTSMFAWLLVLIVTSMLFRGFVPIRDEKGPYAGMLVATVIFEEAFRGLLWYAHKHASVKLRELANVASVGYTEIDELALAYSVGWGHGAVHLMMQFLPFLPLTWGKSTLYDEQCPSMNLFMMSCLTQLGVFGILASAFLASHLLLLAWRPGATPALIAHSLMPAPAPKAEQHCAVRTPCRRSRIVTSFRWSHTLHLRHALWSVATGSGGPARAFSSRAGHAPELQAQGVSHISAAADMHGELQCSVGYMAGVEACDAPCASVCQPILWGPSHHVAAMAMTPGVLWCHALRLVARRRVRSRSVVRRFASDVGLLASLLLAAIVT